MAILHKCDVCKKPTGERPVTAGRNGIFDTVEFCKNSCGTHHQGAEKIQAHLDRMKKSDSAKLDQILSMLGDIVDIFGKRFDKIDDRMARTAPKEGVAALHVQVNSIETQLTHARVETRLADLEEKVFGAPRR